MTGDMSVGIMGAGLTGMQRGYQTVTNAANNIAQQSTVNNAQGANGDLARPLVNLGVGERQTEASASVIRSADEMVGTLIDVMA